jgi:hypothetical protein
MHKHIISSLKKLKMSSERRRGVERENCEGQRHRHGQSHRHVSSEVRYHGGDRVPGRVPQRGGDDGEWIDVRPRRRKARRQEALGQDRLHGGERLKNRDDYNQRQSRVRYASWEDRYFGECDTVSDYSDRTTVLWGDCEIEDDEFYLSDRRGKKDVAHIKVRRLGELCTEKSAGAVLCQQAAKVCSEECNYGDMYYSDSSRRQVQVRNLPHRHVKKCYGKRLTAVNVKPLRQVVKENDNSGAIAETSLKRYVTFYVTNFPPQASNFFLRKGV